MNSVIRLGLFGASDILERVMCQAFIKHPNFVIVGLASKSSKKLERISRQLKCKKYSSYNDLINSNSIDAAYISLPNSLHYSISKKLLNKGIHCLVEKPMTCSEIESIDINNLAKERGIALVETFQFQYHSQFNYIKNIINKNILGSLRFIDIKFGFPLGKDKPNIRFQKGLKGGAFFDIGVYICKTACLLSDISDAQVKSNIYYLNEYEVDMYGACLINSNNDISILGSWGFDNSYSCSIDLWFSKGNLIAKRIFTAKNDFVANVDLIEKNNVYKNKFIDDQYYKAVDEFYLTILSNTKMLIHYSSNLRQSCLMEKILKNHDL